MPLTPEELALHDRGIGASMIAAVVGVNPFSRPIDVWLQLTGRAKREMTEDGELRAGWGHQMEDMLAAWYEDETGVELSPCPTLIHPEYPWAIATPDRVGDGVLVECKHVGERVAWHWYDGPPDYVVSQCVWQMFVCRALGVDAPRVDVVADVGGAPPQIFPVEYDYELEAGIFETAEAFWRNHVLADVQPEVDDSATYQNWLRRQFPQSNGVLRAEPAAEVWAREYEEAKTTINRAERAKETAANNLRALIGPDDGVHGPWGQVTNRSTATGTRTLRVRVNGISRVRPKRRATVEDIDI